MQLGAYTIEREIGRGGAGTVFLARDPHGAAVAVKTLRLADARDQQSRDRARARFLREIQSVLSLADVPGFVPVLDAGTAPDGTPWLSMPFLGGGTLREKLKHGRLGVEAAVALGRTLADTLGKAHARGIVHRDLKPENVLFTEQGEARVADLGLAKVFTPGAGISLGLSKTGDAHGTVGYMAPECLDDSKHATPEADVFGLGAILHECLSGEPAFTGTTALEVVAAVALGKFEPLAKLCPEAPAWLRAVVEQALATDVEDRFRDGSTLAAALGAREAAALTTPKRSRKSGRRGFLGWLIALAALVSASSIVAYLVTHGSPAPATGPSPTVVPVATPSRPTSSPLPSTLPGWFRKLPEAERPRFPLPKNVVATGTPRVYRHDPEGTELVFVPEGPCLVGGIDDDAELVSVPVGSFFVGRYEVTNAQYKAFVDAQTPRYETDAERNLKGDSRLAKEAAPFATIRSGYDWRHPFEDTPDEGPDERAPVVYVSWQDAHAYCKWAGLRLLVSDEWEKAAAWDPVHGVHRRYAWGDEAPGAETPKYGNVAVARTQALEGRPKWLDEKHPGDYFAGYEHDGVRLTPVGHFPAGASFYGALDMTGNAAEWVNFALGDHQGVRGGSFWHGPYMCQTKIHSGDREHMGFDWLGFRVALSERP